MDLLNLAKTNDRDRDKFVSRFLGIFSEDIARLYFSSPFSEYIDLSRPTIKNKNGEKGHTLDFTLENKADKKIYVCEMKCELEFENYKYIELNDIGQIHHHIKYKEAFRKFLDLPLNKSKYIINVSKAKRKNIDVNGIILLWGKITKEKSTIDEIKKEYNFFDILSLENMINVMIKNNYSGYTNFINEKEKWVEYFFKNIK